MDKYTPARIRMRNRYGNTVVIAQHAEQKDHFQIYANVYYTSEHGSNGGMEVLSAIDFEGGPFFGVGSEFNEAGSTSRNPRSWKVTGDIKKVEHPIIGLDCYSFTAEEILKLDQQ